MYLHLLLYESKQVVLICPTEVCKQVRYRVKQYLIQYLQVPRLIITGLNMGMQSMVFPVISQENNQWRVNI